MSWVSWEPLAFQQAQTNFIYTVTYRLRPGWTGTALAAASFLINFEFTAYFLKKKVALIFYLNICVNCIILTHFKLFFHSHFHLVFVPIRSTFRSVDRLYSFNVKKKVSNLIRISYFNKKVTNMFPLSLRACVEEWLW